MSTIELVKLVITSGELGLLALILLGLFRLALTFGPQIIAAINGHTARLAAVEAKVDALTLASNETRNRASEAYADVAEMRGVMSTGQHAAVTVERPPLPSSPDTRRRP